jgi:AAA domain
MATLPVPVPAPGTAPPSVASITSVAGRFAGVWSGDLRQAAEAEAGWLWEGYLAPGNVTLLTGQWKSGKTTLVAVLLSRLGTGGVLGGLPVRPGKAVVITEESPAHWYYRGRKLLFGDHVCWFCRPFRGRPNQEEWLALLDQILLLHEEHGLALVVIDPLAHFLTSRSENNAAGMLEALTPLERLTARGISVLILYHPTKGKTVAGQAARGSGALGGYADVVLEMQWFTAGDDADRRRRLRAYSRHAETPRHRVIELTADGTDYVLVGDVSEETGDDGGRLLRQVLAEAGEGLTRRELLERWPPGWPRPNEVTLWRWLGRAVAEGWVRREGTGRGPSPYRFGLAEWDRGSGPDGAP